MNSPTQLIQNNTKAVFGISGWSGSGKTTLIEKIIPHIRVRGLTVGILKHAHHNFDIDHPQKDSHRFRQAGCQEVAISSAKRWAFICEVHQAEATLDDLLTKFSTDLILVEGYKQAAIPKIEVWREGNAQPPLALHHPNIVAAAVSGTPPPLPPNCTILPLDDAAVVADFILDFIAQ